MKIENSRVSANAFCTCAIILTAALAGTSLVHGATTNMAASAKIVPPMGVAERSDMRFSGFIVGAATPRAITLNLPSVLPEVQSTPPSGMKSGVGALQISGPASSSFGISTQTTATLTSGDNTLTLERIKVRYGPSGTMGAVSGPGMLSSAGDGTIVFGGTLTVGADQAAGAYAGSLVVSVDY